MYQWRKYSVKVSASQLELFRHDYVSKTIMGFSFKNIIYFTFKSYSVVIFTTTTIFFQSPRYYHILFKSLRSCFIQVQLNLAKFGRFQPGLAKFRQIVPSLGKFRQVQPSLAMFSQVQPSIAEFSRLYMYFQLDHFPKSKIDF